MSTDTIEQMLAAFEKKARDTEARVRALEIQEEALLHTIAELHDRIGPLHELVRDKEQVEDMRAKARKFVLWCEQHGS